jgi:hypothetical protein
MLKMKYLWTLALVALCVSLASGMAFAQDSWAIPLVLDDDDNEVPSVDLPIGLGWDETYNAAVSAVNDGTTTWTKADGYQLLSVEGTTATGLVLTDRWGMSAVDLATADVIAPDDEKAWAFLVTAPPISGTFDCNWVMGKTLVPIQTALATPWELDEDANVVSVPVVIGRFPDDAGGTAGAWAADQIDACAGRLPFIVQGFEDGLYRPAMAVNRGTMAVYIRRAMAIPQVFPDPGVYDPEEDTWELFSTFPDVPYYGPGDPNNYWAVGDVEALAAEDATPDGPVVAGYSDGTYQPSWLVVRSQMAKFIALGGMVPQKTDDELTAMMDPEDDTYNPDYFAFPDVPFGYWADNFIYALRDANIVLGYPDGLYRPGDNVDRAQMAVYTYRAFIGTTTQAVVIGGPDVTDVDLTVIPDSHGWSHQSADPDWAYIEFDAAAIGPELAGADTWDIVFSFAAVTTPTTIEDTAAVSLDAADLTGVTGDYFTVRAKVPAMTPGEKIMYTTAEGRDGTTYELGRTVTFQQSEPPPPPGAPRTPNGLGGWTDYTTDGWGSGNYGYSSGAYSNMKTSDNQYYVLVNTKSPFLDTSDDWLDCCTDPGSGMTLKWTGFEIPVGATEMKVTLEYHVYDPQDGTGLQKMTCNPSWCSSTAQDSELAYPNFCAEWGWEAQEADPAEWAWIDNVHPNYGTGLVMVNHADVMDWDGSLTGSPSAEIQDTVAEGAYGGAFAYNPTTDMAMSWTVTDWTNFVTVGPDGNEAAIQFCGGSIYKLFIDQLTMEFNPH